MIFTVNSQSPPFIMHSYYTQFLWLTLILLPVLYLPLGTGMTVSMSPANQKVFDNSNISLVCQAKANNFTGNMSLSVRARMFLVLLTIPRGGQAHQVQGVLHCDPGRTSCDSEFNIAVECISDRINISKPMDTLETACQLNDEHICSNEWLTKHRDDCVALGKLTVIKGPKLGERCVYRNTTVDSLLPCGEHQHCNTVYGVCECRPKYRPEKRKCVAIHPDEEDVESQPLITDSAHSHPKPTLLPHMTTSPGGGVQVLPTMSTDDGGSKPTQKSAGSSKALVIFLLVVAILLCIALAVVIIWSRNRTRALAANVS